jgi:hypothetical protein
MLERDAMGSDEYHPISQNGSNLTEAGSIGYMVVDVLDTLQIMGLEQEYARARTWVANLSFDRDGEYSTFEVCHCRDIHISVNAFVKPLTIWRLYRRRSEF